MNEYITRAFVLDVFPRKEHDKEVVLFTEDFGVIKARIVSGMKINSKFSQHLDPLNLVTVRVVHKKRHTLADVVLNERFLSIRKDINKLSKAMVFKNFLLVLPLNMEEKNIWHFFMECMYSGFFPTSNLLKILGYNPDNAICVLCDSKEIYGFVKDNHEFLCANCSLNIKKNELLLV